MYAPLPCSFSLTIISNGSFQIDDRKDMFVTVITQLELQKQQLIDWKITEKLQLMFTTQNILRLRG